MDGEGIRLMAQHLARVKLDAAEQSYALKQRLRSRQEEQKQMLAELELCRRKLSESEATIMMMKKESSRKYCIEERNDWKALVAALNKDRSRVQKENEQLVAERNSAVDEKMRLHRHNKQLEEEMKVYKLRLQDASPIQAQKQALVDSKQAPPTDVGGELQRLQKENNALKAATMREQREREERRVQWALDNQSLKAKLHQLQTDNQGLRGQLLQRTSNSGGFFSDLTTAFRFCSQPPRARRVMEA